MDRIKSVLEFGGILHMMSGAKYVIRNNTIVGIGIHNDILKPYLIIPKNKIESKFGKATTVIKEYEQTDGELWNTTYLYENRGMAINFFEQESKINYINIGEFNFSED